MNSGLHFIPSSTGMYITMLSFLKASILNQIEQYKYQTCLKSEYTSNYITFENHISKVSANLFDAKIEA